MAINAIELSKDYTPEYEPPITNGMSPYALHINPNRPRFQNWYIPLMMRDPRIRFGLEVFKGPILQDVTFEINCYDSVAGDILNETLDRFWENGANSVLHNMLVYGFTGQEVLYFRDEDTGDWKYDKLKFISPYDCHPVEREGQFVGMNVYRTKYNHGVGGQFVPAAKCIWGVNESEINRWFGRTRLYGAFEPWWEKWTYRGFRDLRANWFYRCSFTGPKIGYPPGSTPVGYDQQGNAVKRIPNREIAAQIIDNAQAGAGIAYPRFSPESGQEWLVEEGTSHSAPEALMLYGRDLNDEILEGIGIPPEVLVSDGTGAYAGRQVPQKAFYSTLEEPAKAVKNIVCESVGNTLIWLKLQKRVQYTVKVVGLKESLPVASDGMFPSDVEDHQQSVADGTAGKQPPNKKPPTNNK